MCSKYYQDFKLRRKIFLTKRPELRWKHFTKLQNQNAYDICRQQNVARVVPTGTREQLSNNVKISMKIFFKIKYEFLISKS